MMNRRSNVTFASNVYILNGDFKTDYKFRSMVRGRKSLEKMLKRLAGLDWVPGEVSLDGYTHLLTDVQRNEWELGMYCALLGDREEIVWGLVRDDAGCQIACRCYRTDCHRFQKCRPDYVPGMELPVPPGEISRDNRGPESRPLPRDDGEELIILEPEGDGRQSTIEEIVLGPEPEIRPLEEEKDALPDDAQETVITGASDELMLVLAGPGTGKTHSLLRKLEYMVDKKRMIEADSILLLCFTRAAVREIRDRFLARVESGDYSDDLSRLDIRTFDSFATRLLIHRGVDCTGLDYDARIQKAIDEINSDPTILEAMKHFLVDEIQDLVGVRARLVQTILKNRPPGCGFTLLGDPLQAIYDYNIKDTPYELDSRGFLQWLREEYGERLKVVSLTANRRQTGKLAVDSARSRSLLETEDRAKILEFFELIRRFPAEHQYRSLAPGGSAQEKVAILCRNNGEVLKISGHLWQQEIAHTVRTQHTRWLLPVWLADLLAGHQRITREALADLDLFDRGPAGDPDRLFSLLQDLAGTSGRAVDPEKVRRALTTDARLPDELYEVPVSSLTVSTIHQAKGREFDRVYLLEPQVTDQVDDLLEEARVYYVALTRARNDFRRLARPFTWLKATDGSGRWMELGRKPDGRPQLVGMEVGLQSDVDEESFVDTRIPGFDPQETQRYIREVVAVGDPLSITRLADDDERYGIYHRDRLIGRMSDRFTSGVREVMNSVYGRRSRYLPLGFSGVYVGHVYGVIRKPETISPDIPEPYISTGVWYAVNPVGMSKVRFDW